MIWEEENETTRNKMTNETEDAGQQSRIYVLSFRDFLAELKQEPKKSVHFGQSLSPNYDDNDFREVEYDAVKDDEFKRIDKYALSVARADNSIFWDFVLRVCKKFVSDGENFVLGSPIDSNVSWRNPFVYDSYAVDGTGRGNLLREDYAKRVCWSQGSLRDKEIEYLNDVARRLNGIVGIADLSISPEMKKKEISLQRLLLQRRSETLGGGR